jgi:hypothetical protein
MDFAFASLISFYFFITFRVIVLFFKYRKCFSFFTHLCFLFSTYIIFSIFLYECVILFSKSYFMIPHFICV